MPDESSVPGQPYEIVSVRRSKPPCGGEGSDWHRYIIVQGANTIHGYRQGKIGSVTNAVEEIVVKLNERRLGNRGRVQLVIPKRKKTADRS